MEGGGGRGTAGAVPPVWSIDFPKTYVAVGARRCVRAPTIVNTLRLSAHAPDVHAYVCSRMTEIQDIKEKLSRDDPCIYDC